MPVKLTRRTALLLPPSHTRSWVGLGCCWESEAGVLRGALRGEEEVGTRAMPVGVRKRAEAQAPSRKPPSAEASGNPVRVESTAL